MAKRDTKSWTYNLVAFMSAEIYFFVTDRFLFVVDSSPDGNYVVFPVFPTSSLINDLFQPSVVSPNNFGNYPVDRTPSHVPVQVLFPLQDTISSQPNDNAVSPPLIDNKPSSQPVDIQLRRSKRISKASVFWKDNFCN